MWLFRIEFLDLMALLPGVTKSIHDNSFELYYRYNTLYVQYSLYFTMLISEMSLNLNSNNKNCLPYYDTKRDGFCVLMYFY